MADWRWSMMACMLMVFTITYTPAAAVFTRPSGDVACLIPRPDRPAIDVGDDNARPDSDQLGLGRVAVATGAQAICDTGAIAFQPDLDL